MPALKLALSLIHIFATNYVSNQLTLKHQRKVEVLKVILDAAYKEYEFRTKQKLEIAKVKNEVVEIASFTEYIIFYAKIAETITKENLKEEDILNSLKENKILIDSYYKYRDQYPIERKINNQ